MNHRATTLLLAAALTLSACGEPDDGGATPPTSSSDPGLAGTSWVVVSFGLDGADDPVLPNAVPTIAFDADGVSVGGTTGCNSWFGTVALPGGRGITFTDMGWTEMACLDGGVMDQEHRFLEALARTGGFTLDGDALVLAAADGSSVIQLGPAAPAPDLSLTGDWRLTTFIDGEAASSVMAGTEITLSVDVSAATLSGNGGCNGFSGGMAVESAEQGRRAAIVVYPLASTLMACEPAVMDQEQAFHAILGSATEMQIDGGRLLVTTDDGRGLVFEPAEA